MKLFSKFLAELAEHSEGNYHRPDGPLDPAALLEWSNAHNLHLPEEYVEFMTSVGSGRFYSGAITIFPLTDQICRSVESDWIHLRSLTDKPILPFGYDGTTDLSYCISIHPASSTVSSFYWESSHVRDLAPSFYDWIEHTPATLFNDKAYAAYRKIRDAASVWRIIGERTAFSIKLVCADKKLQRPPDKPDDLLPRYNKLTFSVTKLRPVALSEVTIPVERTGSALGATNVVYIPLPVADLAENQSTEITTYAFDPFNVPFIDFSARYSPAIDLSAPSRVRFGEIAPYL